MHLNLMVMIIWENVNASQEYSEKQFKQTFTLNFSMLIWGLGTNIDILPYLNLALAAQK